MEITVDQLLKGKGTKIKEKEYYATERYVEPFLNRMEKLNSDYVINVKLPDQMTLENNIEDITYNRVWIQAILPEELQIENHKEVMGLVYGLDVRKPVFKIYRGALNMACLNLCVFNPTFLKCFELEPNKFIDYSCVDTLLEQTNDIAATLQRMKQLELPREREPLERELGRWNYNIMKQYANHGFGKIKLSETVANTAFKQLFMDEGSPYFIKKDEEVNMFKVYNSFTEIITNGKDKDIMNKVEKTLLLKDILEL